MAITEQGQTSGDTNATPQTTGASYTLIYDPSTDGPAGSLLLTNDEVVASTCLVKAERWSAEDGDPREYEVRGGENVLIRGIPAIGGAFRPLGKVWIKDGSASCAVRWYAF